MRYTVTLLTYNVSLLPSCVVTICYVVCLVNTFFAFIIKKPS